MPCTPFTLANGARGFLCSRRPRPRCACGTPATLQCDAPTRRSTGTCDRHLCTRCAIEVGPDLHVCAAHADRAPGPVRTAKDVQDAQGAQQTLDF